MERLTERNEYGVYYPYCDSAKGCGGQCANCEFERKIAEKLADYEDAEEQGLLLRLPFKIGQKVYYIYESCIDKSLMIGSMVYSYSCLDFPKNYFETREEAEQALKRMESE